MNPLFKKSIISCLYIFISFVSFSQTEAPIAIDSWRNEFYMNQGKSICYDASNEVLYMGSIMGIVVYDIKTQEISTLTKTSGLSDIDVNFVSYNKDLEKLFIIYKNSNIDIYEKGVVRNYPYIKNSNISGDKNVTHLYENGNYIYLNSGIGVINFDLEKEEIKETYSIASTGAEYNYSTTMSDDSLYVAMKSGIYSASKNSINLLDFNQWKKILPQDSSLMIYVNNALIYTKRDSLFSYKNGTSTFFYALPTDLMVNYLKFQNNKILICAENNNNQGFVYVVTTTGITEAQYNNNIYHPMGITYANSSNLYIADYWNGLKYINGGTNTQVISALGPKSNDVWNIVFNKNKMYCPAGSVSSAWTYLYNRNGMGILSDNIDWTTLNSNSLQALDTFLDILDVAIDPVSNSIFMASYGDGLMEIKTDGTIKTYKEPEGLPSSDNYNRVRISSLQYDNQNRLWMNICQSQNIAAIRMNANGTFTKIYGQSNSEIYSGLTFDDAGNIWFIGHKGDGLYVVDSSKLTKMRKLTTGEGYGNLPNNEINCISKDLDGSLWIGTADGIGIISCPESVLTNQCESESRIVQYDNVSAGYLFKYENVRTIAVDGANRKWIGTDNGVWLLTSDAEKILKRFDISNSPLPSNIIKKIAVNPNNGEVFFATELGMVSYRGDATAGEVTNDEKLLVFPNPVPSGYSGTIAIRGVSEDAIFKITDVAGNLVYQGKALGGQAIWNGKTYTGEAVHSGVYYVFVLGQNGAETKSTKFLFFE